jgi:FtsZ-binding cell division protein ZapB
MLISNSNIVGVFAKLKEEMTLLKEQNRSLKLQVEKPQESADDKKLEHENETLKAEYAICFEDINEFKRRNCIIL